MTSMASRYFQGRVIETNEPCYISRDTESCCSKIQSLIELKLEAPNLSTDHQCHGGSEGELIFQVPGFLHSFSLSLVHIFLLLQVHVHNTHKRHHMTFKDIFVCFFRCSQNILSYQKHIPCEYQSPEKFFLSLFLNEHCP